MAILQQCVLLASVAWRTFRRCTSATNLATHMGLLPDIERVWIAIDHNLFLWDYVDGCVDIDYALVHLGLTRPQSRAELFRRPTRRDHQRGSSET